MRALITILVLMTAQRLMAQNDDDHRVIMVGKVVKSDSTTAVPFAFVANSHTGYGKETNESGVFKLTTMATDTLFFRCLGYQDTMLVVKDEMLSDTLLWVVNEKSYELGSVDVLMFKSYASFRHMVANMDMMPDNRYHMPISVNVMAVKKAIREKDKRFGPGIAFGGGSATRKEKKYAAFSANEKRYERFREMTSRENMQYLTKLDGADLDSFMVFLRTKHKINPDLSDYKMMEAINLVFEEFLALNSDSLKVGNNDIYHP
ncbi:hypothetical protein KEM09_04330 [Carboxylicivirga mesophila]|uniref:Carboxypeptidase-like regulatory domain-containing protein n=1 Tax=Carboxylicivirga mesophila TaxID=1166478 RepID=A0ABS5K6I7_9BACT|nr:hypothetical protein [Carboxylicivirga mesophila]MBS2210614.1 hypothetical protein [Carboxylicivirga mesophila]